MLATFRRSAYRPHLKRFVLVVIFFIPPFIALIYTAPLAVNAQSSTAVLTGAVTDQSGAIIVGSSVRLRNEATGVDRKIESDINGRFVFFFVTPGVYSVRVQLSGFATAEVQKFELSVNQQRQLDIRLRAGDINETVTVYGSDSLIDPQSASVGTVVSRHLIENVPLNGRSFQSLVALSPGVVMTKSDTTNQGQFSVNGQRADSNYFTVDGVGANFGAGTTGYNAGGTVPATNAVGSTAGLVPLDALQELNIQTSTYAPEYGRGTGGQVSVITRSGTNRYRGSVFEYLRNDAFDAADWFVNRSGLPTGPLRHNDFGGVLGGPIVRERAFFFVSYEGLRLLQPRSVITRVPSMALRQSAPLAMQPYLNAFPIPNGAILSSTGAELNAVYSNPRNMDSTSVRLDYSPSAKLTFFGRFNYAPSDLSERRSSSASALSTVRQMDFMTRTITLGSTQVIKRNLINELRVNQSISRSFSSSDIDNYGGAVRPPDSLMFQAPFATPADSSFSFSIDGAAISVSKSGRRQKQFNVVDNLSYAYGEHQLRFGVDYRRMTPVTTTSRYSSSITTTGSLVATSRASRVTISKRLGDLFPIYDNFSAYAQDMWSATPRLTVTYGVRWDLNPPPSEKYGNLPWTTSGGYDPAQMVIDPVSYPFWKTPYTNLAPRVGAAYLLSAKPSRETILRGGIGIFYDIAMGTAGASMSPAVTPYSGSKVLTNVSIPLNESQAAPPGPNLAPPYFEIWKFDPELKTPRTYEWSIGVQQAFGSKQSLSASYVASAGRRLISDSFYWDLNDPNPTFMRLHTVRGTGTSDYNSLQIRFERSSARGLDAVVSYTLGSAVDTSSTDSAYLFTTDAERLRSERGPADFDVRHVLAAGLTYSFPSVRTNKILSAILNDWSVGSIVTARTASPIADVQAGYSDCDVMANAQCPRPDIVPNMPVRLSGPQYPGGWRLNPAAFKAPPRGRQGDLGRNALRGFPVFQIDVSLRRTFRIRERYELQFAAEGFNILNHPNFENPYAFLEGIPENDEHWFGLSRSMLGPTMGSTGSSGEAGLNPIYQIGMPRSFQFSLRLKF